MENISFSKIVATPTLNSWSQAYNAGKLFAVLSLEKTADLPPEIESLNMLGKSLVERLEQEFFAIENKDLESIKKAILTVFEKSIEGISSSFAAGAIINNVLYLFCLGNAKVFIKRDDNLGVALECDETSKKISSSSGYLRAEDLIILTTDAFSQVIDQNDLNSSLVSSEPIEITESLAPKIHKSENGKISAIVIKYKEPVAEEVIDEGTEVNEPEEEIIQEEKAIQSVSPVNKYLSLFKSKFKKPNFSVKPTKKIFLVVIIVIVGILVSSVFFAIREQNNAKIKAAFEAVYPQAQKEYDEGLSLLDLNKSFAKDSFLTAQKALKESLSQFPQGSKESIQTQDLLKKIESGLAQTSPVDKSGLDRSKLSIIVQNGSGTEGTAGKAANILKGLGYTVTSTGNANNYNYQKVTIKVKKEQSNFINLLKKDLDKDYEIGPTSSDLPSSFSADALIIVGK